jgi:hypothetical protein
MKYPYIGDCSGYVRVLFTSAGTGVNMKSLRHCDGWIEGNFKNITREYLANTYGKVESKEHAEFIVKLAHNHSIKCYSGYQSYSSHGFCFYINGYDELTLAFMHIERCKDSGEKQITIPLPPKVLAPTATQEEEFEMAQIEKNNGDNLMFAGESIKDSRVYAEQLRKEMGCDDSLLSDKCKEWPAVGDEVEVSLGIGIVKGVGIVNGKKCVFVQLENTCETTTNFSKPKTPKEELRDEITQTIHDDVYNGVYDKQSLVVFANALMKKYNITKKPQ